MNRLETNLKNDGDEGQNAPYRIDLGGNDISSPFSILSDDIGSIAQNSGKYHPSGTACAPTCTAMEDDDTVYTARQYSGNTISRATYIMVAGAVLNSYTIGYDVGTSTRASRLLQSDMDLSLTEREIWVGCLHFWASEWEKRLSVAWELFVSGV